ncbi:MAG: HlyC/CorC family transporter [Gammaproteobacteria bacterium]
MDDIPLGALFAGLVLLIILSAGFSGSETAMMVLNRYRLRHLVAKKHKGAMRANALLEHPDRLIGLILLGNNFVNILASSVATLIALRLYGEAGIAVAALLLTLVVLVFGEVAPKTLAALNPERIAFPAAVVLKVMLRVFYPVVWIVNALANGLLWLLRAQPDSAQMALSREELRVVVKEAGAMIPKRHQKMLLGILDLEKVSVEDIMVPRIEIVGIDLEDAETELESQLALCQHTRFPVFRGSLDDTVGIFHVRRIQRLYDRDGKLSVSRIQPLLTEPYYVPIGTPLHTQLSNFQRHKRRLALVVDEYGSIQGLVTLEDILEEIVGEFTTDPHELTQVTHPQEDGSFLIEGGATIREINRRLRWRLPSRGAKTLNGLILETLETMPEPGTSLRVDGYTLEVVQATEQAVKTARVTPPLRKKTAKTQQRMLNG